VGQPADGVRHPRRLPPHRPPGALDSRALSVAAVQALLGVGHRQDAVVHRRLARRQRDDLLLRDGTAADLARPVRARPSRLVAPLREPGRAGARAGRPARILRPAAHSSGRLCPPDGLSDREHRHGQLRVLLLPRPRPAPLPARRPGPPPDREMVAIPPRQAIPHPDGTAGDCSRAAARRRSRPRRRRLRLRVSARRPAGLRRRGRVADRPGAGAGDLPAVAPRQHVSPLRTDHARAHRARVPDLERGCVERARPPLQAGRSEAGPALRRAAPAARRLSAVVLWSELPARHTGVRRRPRAAPVPGSRSRSGALFGSAPAASEGGADRLLAVPLRDAVRAGERRRMVDAAAGRLHSLHRVRRLPKPSPSIRNGEDGRAARASSPSRWRCAAGRARSRSARGSSGA
jgi:hypothetical protein